MTSSMGTASDIQRKKEISTPASERIRPMAIRFGGDPTGVPMPPIDAA